MIQTDWDDDELISDLPDGPNNRNYNMLLGDLYDDFDLPPLPSVPEKPKIVCGKKVLVNREIRAPQVRLMDQEKVALGVFSLQDAMLEAQDAGTDLVLISPDADPPVARLIEFSKYKYEAEKDQRASKKKSGGVETKEIRLRAVTDVHDYQVKLKGAIKFLEKGNRVKLSMSFSGRELNFKETGKELMLKFVEELSSVGRVEGPINFKTGTYTCFLLPGKS